MQKGETKAKEIISSKLKDLHIIAKGLLEFETLSANDIDDLLKGKKINRQDKDNSNDLQNKSKSSKETTKEKDIQKKPIGSVPITAKNTT